jgi:hypothetical protein
MEQDCILGLSGFAYGVVHRSCYESSLCIILELYGTFGFVC